MLPGLEMMAACTDLAMSPEVMQHVARVESSLNPYAIGVVDGRLVRQPRSLPEAISTARMLEDQGYNFSVGIAQVNRHNLKKYGLDSYEAAFNVCRNVRAGSQILAECYGRADNDLGKALSCYYSGNFTTGFRHGYVQKVFSSMQQPSRDLAAPIALAQGNGARMPMAGRVSEGGRIDGVNAGVTVAAGLVERRVAGSNQLRLAVSPTMNAMADERAVQVTASSSLAQAPMSTGSVDTGSMARPASQNGMPSTANVALAEIPAAVAATDSAMVF